MPAYYIQSSTNSPAAARTSRMLQRPAPDPGASAYVSIRQHTSAYVSIRQHTYSRILPDPGAPRNVEAINKVQITNPIKTPYQKDGAPQRQPRMERASAHLCM